MFSFDPRPTFSWPVKVQVPADGGTFTEETFTARWQLQDKQELRDAQDKHPKGPIAALLEMALKGWSDIAEKDGAAMAFTPENVERLQGAPHVVAALVASYWDAANGGLRAKN